jgi:cytochrome c oxidase subunit 4
MTNTAHARPNYVAVWAWLVLLLVISLVTVKLPFSQAATMGLIFVVAAVKAVLVAAYFMHLRFEGRLIRAIAIIPLLLFLGMTLTLFPDIVFNPFRPH